MSVFQVWTNLEIFTSTHRSQPEKPYGNLSDSRWQASVSGRHPRPEAPLVMGRANVHFFKTVRSAVLPDDSTPFRGGAPMESLRVERLDHFGLIACAIKDLGLIEMLDARLVPDEQEVITPGEAVAGMILNGLGFTHRPLSLTPQFFAHKPLDLLFHDGVEAEMFNRFKLGRTLDEVQAYGCDLLFSELALAVCTRSEER